MLNSAFRKHIKFSKEKPAANRALFILLIITLLLLQYQCEKTTGPYPPANLPAGTVSMNSKLPDHKISGFSFSGGIRVSYPNSQNIKPDISVGAELNASGNPVGVFLFSVELHPAFILLFRSVDSDSAGVFFDTLSVIPDTTFKDLAMHVSKNQVWAIKTLEKKYAKILVTQTRAYIDSTSTNVPVPVGEVTFKWQFQPDGSRRFN